MLDFKQVAECSHVVAPLFEIQVFCTTAVAASVATVVEINDLRDIDEAGKVGFENGMIKPGATMQQEDGRHLAHPGSIGPQLRTVNIEEQVHIANSNAHKNSVFPIPERLLVSIL